MMFLVVKSVFEGNLSSGCLKERRSAGFVFCENTATLYRTLFVSLLPLFVLVSLCTSVCYSLCMLVFCDCFLINVSL